MRVSCRNGRAAQQLKLFICLFPVELSSSGSDENEWSRIWCFQRLRDGDIKKVRAANDERVCTCMHMKSTWPEAWCDCLCLLSIISWKPRRKQTVWFLNHVVHKCYTISHHHTLCTPLMHSQQEWNPFLHNADPSEAHNISIIVDIWFIMVNQ